MHPGNLLKLLPWKRQIKRKPLNQTKTTPPFHFTLSLEMFSSVQESPLVGKPWRPLWLVLDVQLHLFEFKSAFSPNASERFSRKF